MTQLSVQAFNELCQPLLEDPNYVIWARSPDYQKQVYVSPSFSHVWQHNHEKLYANPSLWAESLAKDSQNLWLKKLLTRMPINTGTSAQYNYIIERPDGDKRFIKDQSFFLTDNNAQCSLIAGISKVIPEREWEVELHQSSPQTTNVISDFTQRLQEVSKKNDLQLGLCASRKNFTLPITNGKVILSRREVEALFYLLLGKSAKQTAKILEISPRTVEAYNSILREKMQCNRKMELFQKVRFIDVQQLMQLLT